MLVLGIESSCDETSAAVVEDGRSVRSLVVASQSEVHAQFHGVVPEVASRAHVEQILPVVRQALNDAGIRCASDLDGIAVTNRPGLSGSLAVGVTFAKGYVVATGLPFVAVDHMAAHGWAVQLAAPQEPPLEFPYLVLLVSGGHTILAVSRDAGHLEVLGTTIDDACGEAYDKVSTFLGCGYPGGPAIDRLAARGNPRAFSFPRSRLEGPRRSPYDVSYSGLKTAVVHQLDRFLNPGCESTRENVAASFQHTAISMLVERVERAMEDTGILRVAAGGGVASNTLLRQSLAEVQERHRGARVIVPPPELCIDNGAMVAGLGGVLLARGERSPLDVEAFARVSQFRRGTPA